MGHLPENYIADKKRKQRGSRRQLMPTHLCGPIHTAAEEALYWQLYKDSSCKVCDRSDNLLVMAGEFNQHWGTQLSCILGSTSESWLTCALNTIFACICKASTESEFLRLKARWPACLWRCSVTAVPLPCQPIASKGRAPG